MMKRFLPILLLFSVSALAGFYPVNRGMINQASVTTVTGSTTTYVATSNQIRIAEGANIAGQTFKFPNATNLPVDWWYTIINNSSATVTASNNAGTQITTIAAGQPAYFQLTDNSTAAGTWKYNVQAVPSNIITDHGLLTGLGDDDHPQYHNDARGDARYYTKTQHINASTGAADAGKPIVLNASGVVDSTMLPGGGGLSSVGQYDFGSPANDGATVSGSSLLFQSASSSVPGMVNTTAQSFIGLKTFLDSVKIPTVTASRPLKTDASGVVTSSPIILSSTNDVVGLLPNANLANPSTTVNGQTCTLGSTCTITTGGGNSPTSIGTIDSQAKSANGLVTSSTILYAQTADASFPGLVSTSVQSFKGDKTIIDRLNINTVTASRPLKSDVNKYVTSSQIILSSTNDVVGTLGVANGGTGATGTPTNGQVMIGNGFVYVPATITAGTNITITNGSGSITVSASGGGGGTITSWASYTPVVTNFGIATPPSASSFRYRTVGSDTLEIEGYFDNGDPQAAEGQISLPSGYYMATDYSSSATKGIPCGWGAYDAADYTFIPLAIAGESALRFGKQNSGNSGLTRQGGTAWPSIGVHISFRCTLRLR